MISLAFCLSVVQKFFARFLKARRPVSSPTGWLEAVLKRERSRTDRMGGEFSMLTFSAKNKQKSGPISKRLLAHLRQRTRCVDEVGRIDGESVGFVLSHCSAESATQVAEAIAVEFAAKGLPIVYQVYHYENQPPSEPNQEPPGGAADATSIGTSDAASITPGADGAEPEAVADSKSAGEPEEVAGKGQPVEDEPPCSRPIATMEPLFFRGIPLWKRSLDVLGASIGLIMLAPVFALAALAVKLSSPGPVFFAQRRTGRGGRVFKMYKFRSMVIDAEAKQKELLARNEQDGPAFKIAKDPRITPIGRLLRATSIDELPQLFNVLVGDMSLVGPRPLPCHESDGCRSWQLERLHITPGLTCFWQIREKRNSISFAEWMRLDIRYARSKSPLIDCRLILQTIAAVFRRRGV